jgi:hypothetical protein
LQSGYLQLLLNDRTDKSGGRHITIRQQLIGVTAIGETTGAEYRMVGNVAYLPGFPQATTINDPDPFGTTQLVFHQTLSIQAVPVGGSEADRISIHVLTQATWNANGELAAEVADVNATCDGWLDSFHFERRANEVASGIGDFIGHVNVQGARRRGGLFVYVNT